MKFNNNDLTYSKYDCYCNNMWSVVAEVFVKSESLFFFI